MEKLQKNRVSLNLSDLKEVCISIFNQSLIKKIVVLFSVYFIPLLVISLTNFPYIDDVDRQIKGYTGFAVSYSRWGSEIASWIVQGGKHQADLGAFMYILSSIILTCSSLIIIHTLNRKITWTSIFISSLIGLNPWFLEGMLFKFDNPYMSLSIFFSVFPFLLYRNFKFFIPISILSIFLMCNTYQASSGIYILMVLALVLEQIIDDSKFKDTIKLIFASAISYVIGVGLFPVQLKFFPGTFANSDKKFISSISDIFKSLKNNTYLYLKSYYEKSAYVWLLLALIVTISFVLMMLLRSKINLVITFVVLVSYLSIGVVLSAGVYIIFSQPTANITPRYGYGLAIFFVINLIILTKSISNPLVDIYSKLLSFTVFFYFFSFPFSLASTLDAQKVSFENQTAVLASNLNPLITEERRIVHMNKLFKNSAVRQNNLSKFPIIANLVPDSSVLLWTSTLWFQSLSNLNIEIVPTDFSGVSTIDLTPEISTQLYNIYTNDKEVFVEMK